MARYDAGWGPRYGYDFGGGRDEERLARWRTAWGVGPGPARGSQNWYPQARGYGSGDYGGPPRGRGIYGSPHPGYREYPTPMGGSGAGRGGYGSAYADRPFMPEVAYRRHPEYERPPRNAGGRWPDQPSGPAYGYAGEPDDEEVKQSVRESLYGDSWVDADRIEVEVEDGVVTLTGKVDDYMEARYAWDDAWETPGVRGVVNQLTVSTGPDQDE